MEEEERKPHRELSSPAAASSSSSSVTVMAPQLELVDGIALTPEERNWLREVVNSSDEDKPSSLGQYVAFVTGHLFPYGLDIAISRETGMLKFTPQVVSSYEIVMAKKMKREALERSASTPSLQSRPSEALNFTQCNDLSRSAHRQSSS